MSERPGHFAGCNCPPELNPCSWGDTPPPASADLEALVRQVVDAAYEVGGATLHANSALSDQQKRYWTNRRAELLDYEKRIEKELLAHVASLTVRLAAAEANAVLALRHLSACKASMMAPSQMASMDLAREVLSRIVEASHDPA